MSKSKVTRIAPAPQATTKARAIPLRDITITWPHGNRFEHGASEKPRVITGAQLEVVLEWLGHQHGGSFEDLWDAGYIGLQLEGVSNACLGLSEIEMGNVDANAIFWALGTWLEDLANRVSARLESRNTAEATVTIAPDPTAVA